MTTGVMDSVRDPVRTARTLADGLQQRPDFARSATAAVVGTVKFGQELAHTEVDRPPRATSSLGLGRR